MRSALRFLDRATANIDQATDEKIQATLRTNAAFAGATKFIVAHRLNTVIDCDIVVVLRDGKVVEAGHPHELLQRGRGAGGGGSGDDSSSSDDGDASFASMVKKTGAATAAHLRAAAATAWENKRKQA